MDFVAPYTKRSMGGGWDERCGKDVADVADVAHVFGTSRSSLTTDDPINNYNIVVYYIAE